MQPRNHLLRAATPAVSALLSILLASLLWGCSDSQDPNQDKSKTQANPDIALAKSADDSSGPVSLVELFAGQSVAMGMEKAALVEELGRHPGHELIEITLHNRDLTLLLAPASPAHSPAGQNPKESLASMIFLLHDDCLAVALEVGYDQAEAVQARDEAAGKLYGKDISFPPRGLREWAAENDYFDSGELLMYLNVEDAVARNFWHESNVNASFRQTKSKGDHFWFMLRPKRTRSDGSIRAIYGLIDPHGLPDNLQESGRELESVLRGLTNTLRFNLSELGFSGRY